MLSPTPYSSSPLTSNKEPPSPHTSTFSWLQTQPGIRWEGWGRWKDPVLGGTLLRLWPGSRTPWKESPTSDVTLWAHVGEAPWRRKFPRSGKVHQGSGVSKVLGVMNS